jgi:hypothetical protein
VNWCATACTWSSTAASSRNRIHSALIAFGYHCPVSDLFGVAGRQLLQKMDFPEPWKGNVTASLELIDDLNHRIDVIARQLKRAGADRAYVPLLMTAPGIGWINGYTIASELGDIHRFASPAKLVGDSGLCPRVKQSGALDARGPLSKAGPRYLRWGLMEGCAQRPRPPGLRRALPNDQTPARSPARPQSRADRPRTSPHRGDLAHADPRPTLRSGRRHLPFGCLTARYQHAPPERAPITTSPHHNTEAIET